MTELLAGAGIMLVGIITGWGMAASTFTPRKKDHA